MKRFSKIAYLVLCFLLIAGFLISCDSESSDEPKNDTESNLPQTEIKDDPKVDPEPDPEPEPEPEPEPNLDRLYTIVYQSNGDGTCSAVDILVAPSATEAFSVTIPQKSPEGELVTAVKTKGFSNGTAPLLITEAYWNALDGKIKEAFGITYHPTTGEAIYYPYPEDYVLYVKWASGELQSCYTLITPEDVLANPTEYQAMIERYPLIGKVPVYVQTAESVSEQTSQIWDQLLALCEESSGAYWNELTTIAEQYDVELSLAVGGIRRGTNIEKIYLPETLTSIGTFAFKNTTGLESIVIPNSVTSIGEGAFFGCTSLTSVTLPNQLTSIDGSVFSQCTSLASITIPASVTEIAPYAFEGCTSLTGIALPNGLKTLGDFAFSDCRSLKTITIPESVTFLGNSILFGCSSLEHISLSFVDGASEPSAHPFCRLFGTATYSESIKVQWKMNGRDVFYYLPEALEAVTVTGTEIPESAFAGCSSLLTLTVSDGVTFIGKDAFLGCMWFKFITIADSVTRIDATFEDTDYYYNPSNWESGVLYIGNHLVATRSAELSGEYQVKAGTVSIVPGAFAGCSNLTKITLPQTVTSIYENTFADCSSLVAIVCSDRMAQIDTSAFDGTAYYNNEANWKDGCLYFDDWLMVASASDMIICVQEGTTKIADGAFSDCTNLVGILVSTPLQNLSEKLSACENPVEIYFLGTEEQWKSVNGELSEQHTIFFGNEAKTAYALKLAELIFAQQDKVDEIKPSFEEKKETLLAMAQNSSRTKLTMNAVGRVWQSFAILCADAEEMSFAYQIMASEQTARSMYEQLVAYLNTLSAEEREEILASISMAELEATLATLEATVTQVKGEVQSLFETLVNATWRNNSEKNKFRDPSNQFNPNFQL